MKKLVVFALILFVSSIASTAGAYTWFAEYNFPATRLIKVPGARVEIDHCVYSFTDAQGRPSLLFACHGAESDGEYYAYLGGKYYSDYASAVDNEIRYHIKRGDIRNTNFEKVYFLTCHAGYASQKTVNMPVLNKPLQMALYNKNVQAIGECFDSQGRVYRVILFQDHSWNLDDDGVDPLTMADNFFIMAGDSDE